MRQTSRNSSSSQEHFTSHHNSNSNFNSTNKSSQISKALLEDYEEELCPTCIEPFDDTDVTFLPCTCNYRVCMFCVRRIMTEFDKRCPGCRKEYSESSFRFEKVDPIEAEKKRLYRLEQQKKPKNMQSGRTGLNQNGINSTYRSNALNSTGTNNNNNATSRNNNSIPSTPNNTNLTANAGITRSSSTGSNSGIISASSTISTASTSSVGNNNNPSLNFQVSSPTLQPISSKANPAATLNRASSAGNTTTTTATTPTAVPISPASNKVPNNNNNVVLNANGVERPLSSNSNPANSNSNNVPILKGRAVYANMKVTHPELVELFGLSPNVAKEQVLRRNDYFGQYGNILTVVINNQNMNELATAYILYSAPEEAQQAIQSVNGFVLDGNKLIAQLATAKYCRSFLTGHTCRDPKCLDLHKVHVNEEDPNMMQDNNNNNNKQKQQQQQQQQQPALTNNASMWPNNTNNRNGTKESWPTLGDLQTNINKVNSNNNTKDAVQQISRPQDTANSMNNMQPRYPNTTNNNNNSNNNNSNLNSTSLASILGGIDLDVYEKQQQKSASSSNANMMNQTHYALSKNIVIINNSRAPGFGVTISKISNSNSSGLNTNYNVMSIAAERIVYKTSISQANELWLRNLLMIGNSNNNFDFSNNNNSLYPDNNNEGFSKNYHAATIQNRNNNNPLSILDNNSYSTNNNYVMDDNFDISNSRVIAHTNKFGR